MNAIAAPKSRALNWLEGFALTFLLQGFPTFASAALLLKLAHHEIAGGVVLFVVMASIFHGLLTPWLAPKFPKLLEAQLRAAVLQCQPVVCRKDREVARPAHDVASTGDERAVAVAAGGGGDEYEVICAAVIPRCAHLGVPRKRRARNPFGVKAWLRDLREIRARVNVLARIDRLSLGNPGDVAPVGEGTSELRIHYGPGYRVYYVHRGRR